MPSLVLRDRDQFIEVQDTQFGIVSFYNKMNLIVQRNGDNIRLSNGKMSYAVQFSDVQEPEAESAQDLLDTLLSWNVQY